MKIKSILIFTVLVLFSFIASGQKAEKKITIRGEVKDSLKAPVKDGIIFIDNVKTGSVTNNKGRFKIKISPSAAKILVFSPIKGISESMIEGKTTINLTLSGSGKLPSEILNKYRNDELIDVGYGTMKKQAVIAGSASRASNPKFSSYTNIFEMIRGEVPGVQVRGQSVFLQGNVSFGGSSEALFVVDGIAVSQINDVSPSDVKSIQTLKGPATAVYGMQGANGVIMIKTKRGTDK
jgi:TonB-dependent SusC/RagA subfamily outer membrane receptor